VLLTLLAVVVIIAVAYVHPFYAILLTVAILVTRAVTKRKAQEKD
jgi:hypothetical protein